MIKYHGTPITPVSIFKDCMKNRNVLISWANQQDLKNAIGYCNKIMLDNGAFTLWTKNKIVDWEKYYTWVNRNYEKIAHYIIPDVIDGTEEENDSLIKDFFKKVRFGYGYHHLYKKAIPVWHLNESLDRLQRLMECFNYIAFGSSGEYSQIGTEKWHKKMNEAMKIVCDNNGRPKIKIHMLRCLNPKVFTKYPFYSGDSTNLARNHHIRGHLNILKGIEKYNSPGFYKFKKDIKLKQGVLFDF